MPRKARLIVPGAIYHIMGRCLDQYQLFSDDTDRNQFLSFLERYLKQTKTKCYAWSLMNNHYHLLLRIGEIQLWEILKPLNMRYAQYHKMKVGRRGPLFLDRFKSIATQDQNYAQELVRYVHLNPIRAGICTSLKGLDKYPWCGHAALMGKTQNSFQDTKTVLKRFGQNDEDARAAYCQFLQEGINSGSDGDPIVDLVRKSNSGKESIKKASCWVIGDREFVLKAIDSSEGRRLRISRFEREGRNFKGILHTIKKYLNIDEKIIQERHRGGIHSDARKVFAYLAARAYNAPVSEIANFLNVGISAVSGLSRAGREIATKRKITI